MQKEIEKHLDVVRTLENPPDPYLSVRPPFFANVSVDPGPPLSPRQVPQDDSRRPSMMDPSRQNIIRPPVPRILLSLLAGMAQLVGEIRPRTIIGRRCPL